MRHASWWPRHWPGPLTIILKRQPSLKMDLGETEGTVALRVPDHELARDILRATGPMAVSSANISGLPAALTCDEAIDQLGVSVSVYLDGGRVGDDGQPASTIVDFTQSRSRPDPAPWGPRAWSRLPETLPDMEDLVEDDVVAEPRRSGCRADRCGRRGDRGGRRESTTTEVERAGWTTRWSRTSRRRSETAEDIRAEIENIAAPTNDDWHEPTTDELRITHPDHDIDQPDLFATSEEGEPTSDRDATTEHDASEQRT